ncbi:MAG: exodeoxyribonuclease VII large subunit, partial [Verrucomicrobiota bacterium]
KFEPEDGVQVVVEGDLTVYKPRGSYQIRVRTMKPEGQGTLQAKFEALKETLHQEGLFDADRKQELPVFPQRIGIVTSPTGAALRDFLQVLNRRCPQIQVVLAGVRVQGDLAKDEIVQAIQGFNQLNDIDLLVVTRGGGSIEDLWAFNEEVVARAIGASNIPVISAIGHEIDFTISDFVADLRAPTPSAAAELVSISRQEWKERLEANKRRLNQLLVQIHRERKEQVRLYQNHYVFREPVRLVEVAMQRLDDVRDRINASAQRSIQDGREAYNRVVARWDRLDPERLLRGKKSHLESTKHQLDLLSPKGVLERGYSLAYDKEGKLITSVSSLNEGDSVVTQTCDGKIHSKISKKENLSFEDSVREKAGR